MSKIAILRRKVRHDTDVSMSASCMFEDICDMHLDGEDGCWATDEHFAERYDVHEKTVSRWRRELQNNGYLRREPDGDRMLLIPNHKIVVQEQNRSQTTNLSEHNRSETTNSSPQNRGTQRDNNYEGTRESAPAREDGELEKTDSVSGDAPVKIEKAVEIGQMVGVPKRLCREWWLHYDSKGWPFDVRSVSSALRKWKLNDKKFNGASGGGGGGDGASRQLPDDDKDVIHFGSTR